MSHQRPVAQARMATHVDAVEKLPSLLGSTPFGWYGPNSGRRLGDPLPRQRYAPATRSWSRSSIAWHAQSRTPAPLPTRSWRAASSSRSDRASTTQPIRWGRCSSTSWLRLPSSRPTSFACARARGWRSPAPGASSRANNPSCPTGSRRNCGACTTPASTRSATWPSCSRCPARRCTGPSVGRHPPHSAEETPPLIAEDHTGSQGRGLSQKSVAKRKHFAISSATNLALSLPGRTPLVLVGYARVSTDDQNLTLQRTTLKQAGCKRIYEEKVSGAKRD